MGKIVKIKCVKPVEDWHTVGATYEFRYSDEEEDCDGYIIDDYEDQHWITLPDSVNPLDNWDFNEHFVIIREEEEYGQ